ncbi:MAG TPA: hypothetical protein VL742_21315, partial [Casimicrobiaceae bacterium]|nr:hypothetical protein [Casimicrobiaceae bacterium]
PAHAVSAATLPRWIEEHAQWRSWIAATGFKAEAGSWALLPDRDSRPAAVLAAPHEGASVCAFAGLPTALPEGKYVLAPNHHSATDAALGWALGSYAFEAYKKRKRLPAALAWPEEADRAEVERLARSVFLARDMINTPAEHMGRTSSPSPSARSPSATARRSRCSWATSCSSGTIRPCTSWAARAPARRA